MRTICWLVLLVGITGCRLTKDVTSNPGARTDFVVGRVYEIEQPVFLFKYRKEDPKETTALAKLGFSGTPTNLSDFRLMAANHPQVAGLLMPGEKVRVTKFVENRVPGLGNFFNVSGVIVSENYRGTVVELNLISKEARPLDTAFVDPAYLEPIK